MNRIHRPFVVKVRKQSKTKPKNTFNMEDNDNDMNLNRGLFKDFDNLNSDMNEINDMNDMNLNRGSFKDFDNLNSDMNDMSDMSEFKEKLEENISSIKKRLDEVENKRNVEDINYALQLIDDMNQQIEIYKKITEDKIEHLKKNNIKDVNHTFKLISNVNSHIENYKKITEERIDKLVRLFLIINNKISSLKIEK